MGKILFIDVDGTLVDYEGRLPESAKAAVMQARKNGHRVYICTGRSKAEVYNDIWELGIDGMIGGNGSYVEDNNQVIMHRLITREQCVRIVDWLHEKGLEFYLESNNGLFASEHFEEKGDIVIKEYSRRKGKADSEEMTVRKAFPDMIFGGELYRDDLNKISFILGSYEDYIEAENKFPDLQAGTWGGRDSEALFGDLGVKSITKAAAVECLLKHIGVGYQDTIAFGDAKIDIPMFECCAVSVAMGNASPDTKAAADMITDDVNDNGLYNAFSKLGLL